jgi:hypothetical protein
MKSNYEILPQRSPPSAAVNSRGLGASGLSPVALLKLEQISQALIDGLCVIGFALVVSIIALGGIGSIGILLFCAFGKFE